MSSVIISGDTSGAITVSAPAVAGTNTLTLQAATATNAVNTLATAVASTSGTSIDFTGIPAWVKRITISLRGISASGTSNFLVRIGSGSIDTSGYLGNFSEGTSVTSTTGILLSADVGAANTRTGQVVLTTLGANIWVATVICRRTDASVPPGTGAADKALSGALDRVRITTVNGTDTFDAGSVNLLLEG